MTKIVVGIDGSEQAGQALRWADREAQLHGASLTAVLAWGLLSQYRIDADEPFDPAYGEEDAQRALDAYISEVLDPDRATLVERQTPCDLPAPALLTESADASLLVTSSRGRGGFTGLLLGSVSNHLISHTTRPLAIIRPIEGTAHPVGAERIVVGVDGSTTAELALRWAAEEARLRDATLVVVHAWHLPYVTGYPYVATGFDSTGLEQDARQVIANAESLLGGLGLTRPVETVLQLGDAAAAVLEAAKGADLIVAGSQVSAGSPGCSWARSPTTWPTTLLARW